MSDSLGDREHCRRARRFQFRRKVQLADGAYDSRRHRAKLHNRGITPKIAMRNTDHALRAWQAVFLTTGYALICERRLNRHQPSFVRTF